MKDRAPATKIGFDRSRIKRIESCVDARVGEPSDRSDPMIATKGASMSRWRRLIWLTTHATAGNIVWSMLQWLFS